MPLHSFECCYPTELYQDEFNVIRNRFFKKFEVYNYCTIVLFLTVFIVIRSVRVAKQDLGRQHKIGKDTVTLVRSICIYNNSYIMSLLFIVIHITSNIVVIIISLTLSNNEHKNKVLASSCTPPTLLLTATYMQLSTEVHNNINLVIVIYVQQAVI